MKAKNFQLMKLSFFIFTLLFVLLIILSPIHQPSNTIKDLSGYVGISDNEHIISHMNFPWKYIYAFGDIWCHQRSERSLFINGNQMPVCARCFGIFFGVSFGLGISIFIRTRVNKDIHKKILILFALGYTPLAVDGVGQLVGLWHSTNLLRLLTGTFAGLTFGVILSMAIDIVGIALSSY